MQESTKNVVKKNLAIPQKLSDALDEMARRLVNEKGHSRLVVAGLLMLLSESDEQIQRRVGEAYGASGSDEAMRRMIDHVGGGRFLAEMGEGRISFQDLARQQLSQQQAGGEGKKKDAPPAQDDAEDEVAVRTPSAVKNAKVTKPARRRQRE